MSEKDHDLLIRVDENVRNLAKSVNDKLTDHTTTLTDHETRMRTLETTKEQVTGSKLSRREVIAWISAVAVFIGALWWLPELIKRIASN